jgi:hypothetical protein
MRSIPIRTAALAAALVAFAALAVPAPAAGATAVPAAIDADATWTAAGSPYELARDTRVAEGVWLTIEAGATVRLAAGASLIVAGGLAALGTAEAPVTFTGAPGPDGAPARWGSVRFEDTAIDRPFEGHVPAGGSQLRGCVFEHGTRALVLEAASPYIVESTFRDNECLCTFEFEGGAAILVGEGSAPRIRGCTFEDNAGQGLCYGGAIYVDKGSPILQDNVFRRNTAIYGGAVSTFFMASPIVGNVFEDNTSLSEGGALSLVSSASAILDNVFRGNHAHGDGGAVHVCVTCFPHANVFLHDNTVEGNTNETKGAAGVGAAYLRGFSRNNVTGNLRAGEPADFAWHNAELDAYPERVWHADAAGNWWGTTDAAFVDATIFDGADEEGLGPVSWFPPLDAPVTEPLTRVTVTTRKLRYTAPGEPLPVFVTLYNPGRDREAELVLLVDYGDGQRSYWREPLGLVSEVVELDRHRVVLEADAVYFVELAPPPYPGGGAFAAGTWTAALFDAATGEALGPPCTIGFELAHAPAIEPGEDVPE